MKPTTGRSAHGALWAIEIIFAFGTTLAALTAAAAAVGLIVGLPWWAALLVAAYPAGHLASLTTRAPAAAKALKNAHQRIHRQITDRTAPTNTEEPST